MSEHIENQTRKAHRAIRILLTLGALTGLCTLLALALSHAQAKPLTLRYMFPGGYGVAPASYAGIYSAGSVPGITQNMGDFLCAVAMECGCPLAREGGNGYYKVAHVCHARNGSASWRMCQPFPTTAQWCEWYK